MRQKKRLKCEPGDRYYWLFPLLYISRFQSEQTRSRMFHIFPGSCQARWNEQAKVTSQATQLYISLRFPQLTLVPETHTSSWDEHGFLGNSLFNNSLGSGIRNRSLFDMGLQEQGLSHLGDDIEEAVVLPPSIGQPFSHKLLIRGGGAVQCRPAGLLHGRKGGRLLRLVLCRGKKKSNLSDSPKNRVIKRVLPRSLYPALKIHSHKVRSICR
jgi:hypothetical protein